MGGIGSGRHWQFGADTTDDYRSIDIRWLKREGLLDSTATRKITWSTHGEVTGAISVQPEPGRVILDYHHRDRGGEWQAKRYPVYLETTPCHMGGVRHWFLCPARGCGRRVAILYGGAIFACRHCYELAYPSQREKHWDRSVRKADRIRKRLDWEPGCLNGWGPKPKGMHWQTFEHLVDQHDKYVDAGTAAFMARFGGA